MQLFVKSLTISVGARSSPLSRVQVEEVLTELRKYHPSIEFETSYVVTSGDRDQVTSLRTLEKTNFFTKEIDEYVLDGRVRIGIHSAKDLPEPLPDGLAVVCLTEGISSKDCLVLQEGESIASLPANALIATSSERREQMVKQLRNDLQFCDLRGTIQERLAKIERGEVAGVVVAEAALIRLKLTHLNVIQLQGPTAKGQGKLAVVACENDYEIKELFACINGPKHEESALHRT